MGNMLRLLVVLAVAWCCTAEAPVVNTTLGPISGFNKGTTNVFLGVPFAKPPIKELRWKAPVSPDPWTSVRESTKASPKCAQLRILKDLVQGSEDCLTVDIYMPTNPSSTPRPVMLWIHGGAFIFGTSDKYDGTGLAEAFDAVVFVIQYRLDIFGFFALEALRAEDPNSSVGNYGLQDQQLAMKWVLANAKAFGGDDEHVLLFGESAGAISVCAHLAMPSSKGLFHSAVVESGTCDNPEFFFDLDRDERFGLEYAAAVGCNQTTGAAVVECMREMSLADVMIPILKWLKHEPKWSSDAPPLAPVFMFGPTIDGSVAAGLPSLPLEAFEQKKGNVVPTIMGTNKDEGQTFCPITPLVIPGNTYPVTKKGVKNALIHLFDSATADEILEEYPRQTKLDPTESTKILAAIIRDYVFVCPTRRALRALNGEGGKTYSYSFTYPLHNLLGKLWGDYHAAEIPFVFQENNKRDDDKKMQHAFGQYWTNLALTGSPNGDTKGTLPTWPDFSETEETMLMTQPLNITSHLEHAVCDFWDKIHGRFRKARH